MGASKRMDKPLFCRYESHEWKTIELEVFNTFVACRTLPQICIRSDLLQVWRSPMEHYHIERQADALTAISVSRPLRHNNSSSSSNLTPSIPLISLNSFRLLLGKSLQRRTHLHPQAVSRILLSVINRHILITVTTAISQLNKTIHCLKLRAAV